MRPALTVCLLEAALPQILDDPCKQLPFGRVYAPQDGRGIRS
jgi:hypothetical protein